MSRILGVLSILAGVFLMITGYAIWQPVSDSLDSITQGISSAERSIDLLSSNFGSSSSLVRRVTETIRQTSEIVEQTHSTLTDIRELSDDAGDFFLTAKLVIENLPSLISNMISQEVINNVVQKINAGYTAVNSANEKLDRLIESIEPLPVKLNSVASGVDSLAYEVFVADSSFMEASASMSSAKNAIDKVSGSRLIPFIISGFGLIPILSGIYLLLLSAVFSDINVANTVREDS